MRITRRQFAALLGASPVRAAAEKTPGYATIRNLLGGRSLLIVPFSHVDWAWTNSRAWMIRRHANAMEEVLDIIRKMPEFRFYIETWNEQMEPFLARKPERLNELRRAIQEGKVEACGGVCNQHPGWMESESLVRDMVMGRRFFQEFAPGLNLDVMIHLDVTPGSSQMPQILNKAGYRYYAIHRPEWALVKEGVPLNFIWKGLDGSELLTSRGAHCGFINEKSLPDDAEANWPAAVENLYKYEISSEFDSRKGAPVWLPLGCDDTRPMRFWRPSGTDARKTERLLPVPRFIAEWNRRETSHMSFGTPLDVFRQLEKQRDSIPAYTGTIDPTMWTFWYGLNGNEGLRLWRTRTDQTLVSGECFWNCAASLGAPYPEKEFKRLWHDLLRVYSHAQMWLFTGDYAAQMHRLKATLLAAQDLRQQALENIAGRVRVKENCSCVLLFNDLPWERTEVVQVWAELQDVSATSVEVRDGRGDRLDYQVIDVNWYEGNGAPRTIRELSLLVRARVPAMGYTVLYFNPVPGTLPLPEKNSTSGELDAGIATLTFSGAGIESLLDKETGARYSGLGNVQYNEIRDTSELHYGPVVRVERWTNAKVESTIRGPLRSSFTMRGSMGPHFVRISGHVYPHAKRIAFDATIDSAGGTGHFMTTTGLPARGKLAADVHFGVEDRDVTRIPYAGGERMRKNVFYGAHWTDYSDGQKGLTLIGTTGEKGYQFFPEENRLGHFLLMTNGPATNWERFVTPAREGKGRHTFDYQFLLHRGGWKEGDVVRRALEARFPITVAPLGAQRLRKERNLPEERGFLKISGPQVQLSAFYQDAGQHVIRVFEATGGRAEADVEVPFQVASAREIDFNGQPRRKSISIAGRSVRFTLQPWEIVTLSVRP